MITIYNHPTYETFEIYLIWKNLEYLQVEEPVEEDPWQSEDIFEHNENRKPIKRIKCYRLPACLKKKKGKFLIPKI
jgi:hypothetical protein